MPKTIKSRLIHFILAYLHRHARLKSFLKTIMHSSMPMRRLSEKMLYIRPQMVQKEGVCGKRAKRVYSKLRKGIDEAHN